ncbi:MAG: TonB-dependent receptor, partial [Acidobacteriota bacterium]
SEFSSSLADWGKGQVHKRDPLPYISRHLAALGIGLENGRFDGNLLWNLKGKSYDQAVAVEREEIPDARYLDAALRYRVLENWQVYWNADNVLGEKAVVSYRPFGARPGKPYTMVWGLKGTF